jgi:hypothetical protein
MSPELIYGLAFFAGVIAIGLVAAIRISRK